MYICEKILNMVDFVRLFELAATAKNLEFLYGRIDYIEQQLNAEATQKASGLLYVLPVKVTQNLVNGLNAFNTYSTTIGICRLSSLENYYDEKYRTNLREMSELLEEYLKIFGGCSSDITITSAIIDSEINKFSEITDVVLCDLTFKDE